MGRARRHPDPAAITKVHTVLNGTIAVEPGNRLLGRLMSVIDAEECERTKVECARLTPSWPRKAVPPGRRPTAMRQLGPDGRASSWSTEAGGRCPSHRRAPVQGYSLNTVRDELAERAVPPARGDKGWHGHRVRAIVSTPRRRAPGAPRPGRGTGPLAGHHRRPNTGGR